MLCKLGEVVGAYLLPFFCVTELYLKLFVYFLPTLHVNEGTCLLPNADEIFDFVHTVLIMMLKFLPKCAPAMCAIIPRNMMKPKQIVLRASGNVVIKRTIWLAILLSCSTSAS